MKLVERVKIFIHNDSEQLEKQYADWYDAIVEERQKVPLLSGTLLKILDRNLVIRNYEGDETLALAVFYEHVILSAQEQGDDRGQHLKGGVSMMPGEKPRR